MNTLSIIVVLAILGAICAAVAYLKGSRRVLPWFLAGAILFPVAIVIVLLFPPERAERMLWGGLMKQREPTSPPVQRCTAADASGWQCVLPAGHQQPHTAQ